MSATPVIGDATARLAGEGLTCVIGLMEPQPKAKSSIHMDHNSRLRADGCNVLSNSHHRASLRVDADAQMFANTICSSGGVRKRGRSTVIEPKPLTDCPKIDDPLALRTGPIIGGCTATDLVIETDTTLKPGTYCGGITMRANATVQLESGVYTIKDGPLVVTDTAKLIGKEASFYLTGDRSIFSFDANTTIDLSATKKGKLAGLLFFEDRKTPHSFSFDPFKLNEIPEAVRVHRISSNDARNLLGTLYLKNSILLINANSPVADASAYTAIIAGRLWLQEGPTLYLNADYTDTEVPVPGGLIGQQPTLVQ